MLVRCRDEIKMTIAAYQKLYESSIAYGMRKALISEQRRNTLQSEIKTLEDTCTRLANDTKNFEEEIKKSEREDEEDRITESKAHADKVMYLNSINTQTKSELEAVLSQAAPAK